MPPSGIALSCGGLGKIFPVSREGQFLRVLLDRPYRGKTVQALRDVNLKVPRGKILGVLGRNGAGKSTLLRLLGGVYTPTAGQVFSDGRVTGLFELGGVGHRYMTGREYARRSLRMQGAKESHLRALVDDVHEFSELEQAFDQRIHTYSSGMAMRLYFAAATALRYDIYLIDELLAVGDEHFQVKCWSRLRDRLARGASGVLVTHEWSAVIKLCEESCILERGTLAGMGTSDSIVARYLDIDVAEPAVARFTGIDGMEFRARTGEDAGLVLDVEILQPARVVLGYSIELLRIGVGWEILLLGNGFSVGEVPGRYRVRLTIPRLPLAAGSYSFNVFLNADLPGRAEPLDLRSWTVGRGLKLVVEGQPAREVLAIPTEWDWSRHG